jgi:hypothetical protein
LLADAARKVESALELEVIRYNEGESDFTGVFVLQADLVQKQDQLAQAQGDVVTSLVGVYKALGGGWEIRCPGFEPRGVVFQPAEVMEIVPAPEAMPPLPAPVGDEPPVPPAETLPDLITDEQD